MDLIHLDTNYLIGAIAQHPSVIQNLTQWIQTGKKMCVSAVVWAEFLNGPLEKKQIDLVLQMIEGRIYPFTDYTAQLSALLYNHVQRKRDLRFDSLIAASAIEHQASFATLNSSDFRPFMSAGLKIVS